MEMSTIVSLQWRYDQASEFARRHPKPAPRSLKRYACGSLAAARATPVHTVQNAPPTLASFRNRRKIWPEQSRRGETVEALQIVEALNERGRLPIEAIRAAQADRDSIATVFLNDIQEFVSSGTTRIGANALFFAFHLLAEWREKIRLSAARRVLAATWRCPRTDPGRRKDRHGPSCDGFRFRRRSGSLA
jgi:hypothetical protein